MKLSKESCDYISSLLRSEAAEIERALSMHNVPQVAMGFLLGKKKLNRKAQDEINKTSKP